MSERLHTVLVVMLLATLAALSLWAAADKAPTCDEFAHHLASGYSYLLTGDFRMNPASPPVPRLMSAVPMAFLGAKLPLQDPSWAAADSPAFAQAFFYKMNPGMQDRLIFWARVPMVLLSLVFAYCVYGAAKRLFGPPAGLIALTLYACSPNVLAHSALATADLPVAFFFFLSIMSFVDHLQDPRPRRALVCGVFTGMAFLSKFTALLLPPMFLLIALLAGRGRALKPKAALICLMSALAVIWAGYFFECKPLLRNVTRLEQKEALLRRMGGEALVSIGHRTPVPLATFTSSIAGMIKTRHHGTRAFLLGEWSEKGWWYYYFVAFAIKETLPFVLLSIFASAGLVALRMSRTMKVAFATVIFGFFAVTLGDKAQAGIRYFLPVFPFLMISAAGLAVSVWNKGRAARLAILTLLSWHAVEAVRTGPDQFSYFNGLIGGPSQGYRYLRDSNIDWGQDLEPLARHLKSRGNPAVVTFLFTPVDPASYGLRARPITTEELTHPKAELYALGAHNIDVAVWARGRKPDAHVGHSIYLYDLRGAGDDLPA